MSNWRDLPMTERQKECIAEMQEMSEYPLPKFIGNTLGEAADYIDQNIKKAHESTWAVEHGYD